MPPAIQTEAARWGEMMLEWAGECAALHEDCRGYVNTLDAVK